MQVGLGGLLTVLFVALKLCHVVEWSWLWVLAPTWAPAIVAVALLVVGLSLRDR